MALARSLVCSLLLLAAGACSSSGGGGAGAGGALAGGAGGTGATGGSVGGADPGGGGAGTAGSPVGSGGAPDPCERGCAQVEACGVTGVCDAAICDTLTDCTMTCFATASCPDIVAFVQSESAPDLNACIGQCDGGQLCLDCVVPALEALGQCAVDASSCKADPTCTSWLSCTEACTTPSCFEQCDEDHASAASLFNPVYGCMCQYCGELCPLVANACK